MGLQCSITAIGSVIMQWAVNVLGSTAVAAVTAAGKTQSLLTVPMESVGTAMATYAGQNLGASRMDRVRQGVNSAMLIILVYGVGSALILHFTDVQIMSLFLDTAKEVDIVAMGREYLFWNSVFFVPLGALIVWRYSIQGLGFSSLANAGRCGRDGRPHGGGNCTGPGSGILRRGAVQSRRMDRGLPVPVPCIPLDLPPTGQPPADRQAPHSGRPRGDCAVNRIKDRSGAGTVFFIVAAQ